MHYAKKKYGVVNVYIYVFLTPALAGGEWSASRPSSFTPGETAISYHQTAYDVLTQS
jgi:hypothetical protein